MPAVSHPTPDRLVALLPGPADADRPWLVNYSPGSERIELTGHVLSMWASKSAGLLTTESGEGVLVHVDLPVGWRAVTWCLGAWLAGGGVALGPAPALAGTEVPEVSVAGALEDLDARAEVQVLVPRASLAVRFDGETGPLTLDGVADVMSHADRFTPLPAAPGLPALLADDGTRLDRTELAAAALAQAPTARAVLVRGSTGPGAAARAVREVLAAWAGGARAVLVDAACGEELVALAARQERVTGRRPG